MSWVVCQSSLSSLCSVVTGLFGLRALAWLSSTTQLISANPYLLCNQISLPETGVSISFVKWKKPVISDWHRVASTVPAVFLLIFLLFVQAAPALSLSSFILWGDLCIPKTALKQLLCKTCTCSITASVSTDSPLVNCQHKIQDIGPEGGKSFIVSNLTSQGYLEERRSREGAVGWEVPYYH